ncbi:MAG: helix-turn-helix transcriptional regulator [Cohaesibacter sp.]|nr:helix-turn-helix transcriptional regulator [Cohaesibacter sp.]MCV6575733.1 helix-turn-helix transcriptional regulator [Cohaesibacter sp.]
MKKFGMSQNQLAIALGCDRSKISRARKPEKGDRPLIDAYTQVRLLRLAQQKGVDLRKEDLIPDV